MNRRRWGIVLVLGVLLVALAVPLAHGRRIAGRPVAAPIDDPPQVGDCLTWTSPWGGPPVAASRVLDGPSAQDGGTAAADDRAGTRRVSCDDPHQGEIVRVAMDVGQFPVTTLSGVAVPDLGACRDTAYPYLGLRSPTEAGDRSKLLGPWSPPSIGSYGFVSPDSLQRRAGQRWVACVLSSPQGEVRGAARGIYAGVARVNPFAVCSPGTNLLLDLAVPCTRPHPMEILGWRSADESVGGQRPLDQSCAELARRVTGMGDPIAGGALRVAAVVIHYDSQGLLQAGFAPAPHSELGRAACTVSAAGTRLLGDSLVGLGDGPLPWAG